MSLAGTIIYFIFEFGFSLYTKLFSSSLCTCIQACSRLSYIFLLGPAIVLLSSYALYLVFKTMRERKQLVHSNEKFSQ